MGARRRAFAARFPNALYQVTRGRTVATSLRHQGKRCAEARHERAVAGQDLVLVSSRTPLSSRDAPDLYGLFALETS